LIRNLQRISKTWGGEERQVAMRLPFFMAACVADLLVEQGAPHVQRSAGAAFAYKQSFAFTRILLLFRRFGLI
jgi:hypothetical protein